MKPLLLAITIIVSSCTSAPTLQPQEYSRSTDLTFDQVWTEVVEWFAVRNVRIATVEKDSGIIAAELTMATPQEVLASADCGNLGIHTPTRGYIRYNVFVRDDGAGRNVRINTDISLWSPSAADFFQCVSTGSIETAILEAVLPG